MRRLFLIAATVMLSGCTHNLLLMSRGSGTTGTGVASEAGKKVTIELNGKTYRGNYAFAAGGSYSLASMSAFSGTRSATGTGSAISMDASGNGNVLARSDDGSGLRCIFNYGSFSGSGSGVCQDDAGHLYDMQIN